MQELWDDNDLSDDEVLDPEADNRIRGFSGPMADSDDSFDDDESEDDPASRISEEDECTAAELLGHLEAKKYGQPAIKLHMQSALKNLDEVARNYLLTSLQQQVRALSKDTTAKALILAEDLIRMGATQDYVTSALKTEHFGLNSQGHLLSTYLYGRVKHLYRDVLDTWPKQYIAIKAQVELESKHSSGAQKSKAAEFERRTKQFREVVKSCRFQIYQPNNYPDSIRDVNIRKIINGRTSFLPSDITDIISSLGTKNAYDMIFLGVLEHVVGKLNVIRFCFEFIRRGNARWIKSSRYNRAIMDTMQGKVQSLSDFLLGVTTARKSAQKKLVDGNKGRTLFHEIDADGNRIEKVHIFEVQENIKAEIYIHKTICSFPECPPYFITFYDNWNDTVKGDELYRLLMEFAENRDLISYCGGARRNLAADARNQQSQKWLYQMLTAVFFMHNKRFVHLDLSCENILLTSSLNVRVCDFGQSQIVRDDNWRFTEYRGKRKYNPPELYGDEGKQEYDSRAFDIHTVGVVFYILLTNREPYEEPVSINRRLISEGRMAEVMKDRGVLDLVPRDAADLCQKMLLPEQDRINEDGIREHPYFANYHPDPSEKQLEAVSLIPDRLLSDLQIAERGGINEEQFHDIVKFMTTWRVTNSTLPNQLDKLLADFHERFPEHEAARLLERLFGNLHHLIRYGITREMDAEMCSKSRSIELPMLQYIRAVLIRSPGNLRQCLKLIASKLFKGNMRTAEGAVKQIFPDVGLLFRMGVEKLRKRSATI